MKKFKSLRRQNNYFNYINTAFITLPMTLIMSFTGIVLNGGFKQGWLHRGLSSFLVMLPVAYVSILLIAPVARKLSGRILKNKSSIDQ